MGSRLLWRRSATALGIYGSTFLGVLGSIVAARVLGPAQFGRFAVVLGTTAFFQAFLDLTSEEALVKYGFRYAAREQWGRFHRLLRLAFAFKTAGALAAGAIVCAVAPFAGSIFNGAGRLVVPLLIAAPLPLLQSAEGIAAAALVLRSRYDVRAGFLSVSMALRLAALAAGSPHGVTWTVAAVVCAQAVSSAAIGVAGLRAVRAFPAAAPEPLGEERRGILRFVLQSSIGTGILSVRGWIAPLLLGVVTGVREVGLFRAAQAPLQGFSALSAPVRLILLTEQTRDWERGRPDVVLAGLKRYVVGSTVLMLVALAPLEALMPWLFRLILPAYTAAVPAARIVLVAAAVQLVFGWTKSFPVSIGRPGLRIVAHSIESAVLVPFLVAFGSAWGATGAAGAVLVSTLVFAGVWTVLVLRIRRQPFVAAPRPREVTAV